MLLSDCIAAYLSHCQRMGMTRATIRTYGPALRSFSRFLGPEAEPHIMTTDACQRFLDSRDLAPASYNLLLTILHSLSAWLIEHGYMSANPTDAIRRHRTPPVTRPVCSEEELGLALAACARIPDRRRAALAFALLHTLSSIAARRESVRDLRLCDLDLYAGTVYLARTKGGKSQTCYPCQECLSALRAWLRVRGDCAHEYLWAVDRRRRLGDEGMRGLLREVSALAGRPESPSLKPHAIRHLAAQRLADGGANIDTIRAYLGHASIKTTQHYLHSDAAQVRAVRELTAPAARPAASAYAWSASTDGRRR